MGHGGQRKRTFLAGVSGRVRAASPPAHAQGTTTLDGTPERVVVFDLGVLETAG